ncbi:MAG: hypothetical protein RR053_06395 [Evtepia sp.]
MEKHNKYVKIIARAIMKLMKQSQTLAGLMDVGRADLKFNMQLDDWHNTDDFNFSHDF